LWDKFRNAAARGDALAMDKLIPEMEKEYKKVSDPKAANKLRDASMMSPQQSSLVTLNPPLKTLKMLLTI